MKKFTTYFLFTIISVFALLFQQSILNKRIQKFSKENYNLNKMISIGFNKHKEIIKQKELEKNFLLSEIKLNKNKYAVLIENNKPYQDGYVDGYHKAMEDCHSQQCSK